MPVTKFQCRNGNCQNSSQTGFFLRTGWYSLDTLYEILKVGYEDLHMYWMCKLFIHNAPHAIVAYLGWMKGFTYIHEAMADKDIYKIVVGAIGEITDGVIASGFAEKELLNLVADSLPRFFSITK